MKRGYTLVELLVSIAIITIMTGIVVASYSLGRKPETLISETQRFAGELRATRNKAFNRVAVTLSNKVCSLSNATCVDSTDCVASNAGHCVSAQYPQEGFGVHISVEDGVTSYAAFADATNMVAELPDYDGTAELITTVTMASNTGVILADSFTEGEIKFNGSAVSVLGKNGESWEVIAADVTSGKYIFYVEDPAGCEETGKRGIVTIDAGTLTITDSVTDCP